MADDEPPQWVPQQLTSWPVARLATVDAEGDARLVPVCFALVDGHLVSAVDHKPKRTGQLRRLDDVRASGRATLLIDEYDDDWTKLWWVRVRGVAQVHASGTAVAQSAAEALAAKYHQYRDRPPMGEVLSIALDELRWWRWTL